MQGSGPALHDRAALNATCRFCGADLPAGHHPAQACPTCVAEAHAGRRTDAAAEVAPVAGSTPAPAPWRCEHGITGGCYPCWALRNGVGAPVVLPTHATRDVNAHRERIGLPPLPSLPQTPAEERASYYLTEAQARAAIRALPADPTRFEDDPGGRMWGALFEEVDQELAALWGPDGPTPSQLRFIVDRCRALHDRLAERIVAHLTQSMAEETAEHIADARTLDGDPVGAGDDPVLGALYADENGSRYILRESEQGGPGVLAMDFVQHGAGKLVLHLSRLHWQRDALRRRHRLIHRPHAA